MTLIAEQTTINLPNLSLYKSPSLPISNGHAIDANRNSSSYISKRRLSAPIPPTNTLALELSKAAEKAQEMGVTFLHQDLDSMERKNSDGAGNGIGDSSTTITNLHDIVIPPRSIPKGALRIMNSGSQSASTNNNNNCSNTSNNNKQTPPQISPLSSKSISVNMDNSASEFNITGNNPLYSFK